MKTVGIIGGIGPESTIEYYRYIIASYREQKPDGSYPPILINSIDMKRMLYLVGSNQLGSLTDYLVDEIQKLANAGADFGVIASNTPHLVFDEIQSKSRIPIISIVKTACEETRILGLKRLGLFGTRSTMEGQFYPNVFSIAGMTLIVPDQAERDYIHDKYMNELVNGIILPETRERLLAIVERLKMHEGIEGLILGGTELPLILRDAANLDIPFLDTTRIHVRRMVAQMLS